MNKLLFTLYISHQDCHSAEAWRKEKQAVGFPYFKPTLRERYSSTLTIWSCEACGQTISVSFSPQFDNLEST